MAYPISDVTRRVVYTGSAGVGPYSFTFEVLANTDIQVYKNTTLLTLTTNYTVTINANGTGSVTLVVAATGTDTITIVGDRAIQRATDFVTGGDLFANTLNDEFDSLVIFAQQVDEKADRGLKAPVTDPTDVNMVLPIKATRLGTVLAFNATTGNPEAGPSIASVTTVAAQSANINTVATNIASVNTVAGNSTNINTVAGISGNVTTVAGISANVTSVAGNSSNINTVAGNTTNINTVAGISANVTTVAGISANVTSVAGNSTNINAVAGNATNINAVNANSTNINTVAGVNAAVTTVATNIASVNTAATNIAAIIDAPNQATAAANSAIAAAASAASGMYSAVQDKSANYTVVAGDAGDLIRVTTTSGAVTITLPTISTVGDGFKVAIVKWTSDGNAVSVVRSSTNTINGATSYNLGNQYSSATFVADLETGQWFAVASGLGVSNVAVDAFSGNNSTTAFTLSGDPGSENNTQVFVSGVYQEKDTYSVSGTTLTFSTAPPTGTSNIEVVWTAPLAIGTPSDGTVTTAKIASSVTLTTPTLSGDTTAGTINGLTVGKGGGAVSSNTALGASALNNGSLSGGDNFGAGYNSAQGLTTGVRNTILGSQSGQNLTTGSDNILIGYRTVYNAASTGSYNVAVGNQSLYSNTTASNNTAVGYRALYANTTSINNTAVGTEAGVANTTGTKNAFFGIYAGYSNSTGSSNTFVGAQGGTTNSGCGELMTTGSKNSIFGSFNGNQGGLDIRTNSNRIVISDGDGNPAMYWNGSTDWYINGNTSYSTLNFSIASVLKSQMYFDASTTRFYTICNASGGVYLASGGTSWTSASDERVKENLVPIENGLTKVASLRAVTGNYIADESKKSKAFLIAQDVQAVLPEAVDSTDADLLGVSYTDVIPLLVASIKELKTIVDAQAAEIAELKAKVN